MFAVEVEKQALLNYFPHTYYVIVSSAFVEGLADCQRITLHSSACVMLPVAMKVIVSHKDTPSYWLYCVSCLPSIALSLSGSDVFSI